MELIALNEAIDSIAAMIETPKGMKDGSSYTQSKAAGMLHQALHNNEITRPHWLEIDKDTQLPLINDDVGTEGMAIIKHAAGWFNREHKALADHVTAFNAAGIDPNTEPVGRGVNDGQWHYHRYGFQREAQIGFNRTDLVGFLNKNGVAHTLGAPIAQPPEHEGDERQVLTRAIQAVIERQRTKTPAPLFGHSCSEEQQKITKLTKYLKLETWTPEQATFLVNGIDPGTVSDSPYGQAETHATSLAGAPINTANSMTFSHAARVLELWNSRENPPSKVSPVEFVAWCKSKDISTEWITNAAEWTAYVGESAQPESSPAGKAAKDRINTGQVMKKFTIPDEPFFQAWYAPETLAALQYPEDELNRLHSENLHRLALQDEVKAGRIILYDSHSKRLTKRAEIGFADLMSADDFIRFAAESNLVLEKRITVLTPVE